jgi:hypothetical protein
VASSSQTNLNVQIGNDNPPQCQPLNSGAAQYIPGKAQNGNLPSHQTWNNFSGEGSDRSNSAERFDGFKTSGESEADRPDRNQTAGNYWDNPEYYAPTPQLNEFSGPIPEGIPVELASCLSTITDVLSHTAISGKTMAQFCLELSGTMHYGSEVGVLQGLRNFIYSLPNFGHGLPDPESVRALSWAPHLERRSNVQWATLAFTITSDASGGAATIARNHCIPADKRTLKEGWHLVSIHTARL